MLGYHKGLCGRDQVFPQNFELTDLDQRKTSANSSHSDAAQKRKATSGCCALRVEETDLATIPRPIERAPVALTI